MDKDTVGSDEFLGKIEITAAHLKDLEVGKPEGPKMIPLGPSKKHKGDKVRGAVVVTLEKKKI